MRRARTHGRSQAHSNTVAPSASSRVGGSETPVHGCSIASHCRLVSSHKHRGAGGVPGQLARGRQRARHRAAVRAPTKLDAIPRCTSCCAASISVPVLPHASHGTLCMSCVLSGPRSQTRDLVDGFSSVHNLAAVRGLDEIIQDPRRRRRCSAQRPLLLHRTQLLLLFQLCDGRRPRCWPLRCFRRCSGASRVDIFLLVAVSLQRVVLAPWVVGKRHRRRTRMPVGIKGGFRVRNLKCAPRSLSPSWPLARQRKLAPRPERRPRILPPLAETAWPKI